MKYSFGGSSFIVEKELFMHLTNLKVLDLFYGKIHAIHPEAFDNLEKLTSLVMSANRCTSEDFTVQPNGTLDWEIVKGELETLKLVLRIIGLGHSGQESGNKPKE
jgi:hypothetical protein